jgi:hypothetical protein
MVTVQAGAAQWDWAQGGARQWNAAERGSEFENETVGGFGNHAS